MTIKHLCVPLVAATLLAGSAGVAFATSGTTGGSSTTTGTTSSPTTGTTTTVPVNRSDDDNTDWGWLGLLGLAGLAGLLRRKDTHAATHVTPTTTTRM